MGFWNQGLFTKGRLLKLVFGLCLTTGVNGLAIANDALDDLSFFQNQKIDNTTAQVDSSKLAELNDLQATSTVAGEKQLPIMLLFSAQWCEYCEVLKEHALNPMMKSGLYEGKLGLFRHVGIDEAEPLTLISGERMKKSKWAYQLNADLTPTILIIDSRGKEVAERIVGISEITLFSALLHARLNDAYKNMGLKKVIPATPELLEKQVLQQTQSPSSQ